MTGRQFLFLAMAGLGLGLAVLGGTPGCSGDRAILMATTTSTEASGLLEVLLPDFKARSGRSIKAIAVGSGEALAMGARGEVDLVLAHAPAAEEAWMAAGHGVDRRPVMHNTFLILGPPEDPAKVSGASGAVDALRRISTSGASFISRGDDSGTHKKEMALWKAAGVAPGGDWYVLAGVGMAGCLRLADERRAYTLTDIGTFLNLSPELSSKSLFDADPLLHNPYHVLLVNPAKSTRIDAAGARLFADYLVSDAARALISTLGVERFGRPLFVPDP